MLMRTRWTRRLALERAFSAAEWEAESVAAVE